MLVISRKVAKTLCVFALLAGAQTAWGADTAGKAMTDASPAPVAYPKVRCGTVIETHFGLSVRDPFRCLERDPHADRNVAAWIGAQQHMTTAYISSLPGREAFRRSLASTYDYERLGLPQKSGDRYFFTRKAGDRDQLVLAVRDGAGSERVLLDPATWSKHGTLTFAEWRASRDGARVAYAEQDGGSDWRTIRVLDVATGKATSDVVEWVRFTQIAWANDGSGFYYSRYPEPEHGTPGAASLVGHAVSTAIQRMKRTSGISCLIRPTTMSVWAGHIRRSL